MSNGNWMNFMANPTAHYIKRSMFQLMKDKYQKHEQIIERISHSLVTDKDSSDFLAMMVEAYEIGFMRAVEEQRDKLEKLGFGVKITGRQD